MGSGPHPHAVLPDVSLAAVAQSGIDLEAVVHNLGDRVCEAAREDDSRFVLRGANGAEPDCELAFLRRKSGRFAQGAH